MVCAMCTHVSCVQFSMYVWAVVLWHTACTPDVANDATRAIGHLYRLQSLLVVQLCSSLLSSRDVIYFVKNIIIRPDMADVHAMPQRMTACCGAETATLIDNACSGKRQLPFWFQRDGEYICRSCSSCLHDTMEIGIVARLLLPFWQNALLPVSLSRWA